MAEEVRPETPEETLARLAAYNSAASPASTDPTPYGPETAEQPAPATQSAPATPRRARSGLVAGLVVIGVVVAGIGGVAYATIRSEQPERPAYVAPYVAPPALPTGVPSAPPSMAPTASGPWAAYPGTAFIDDKTVLERPSLETISAQAEKFSAEYRAALTAEFGLTWQQTYKEFKKQGLNGYGGTSMLYDYAAAEWRGYATLDDPSAREKIAAKFETLTKSYGGTGYLFSNPLYARDAASSRKQFGADTVQKQAMWNFSDRNAIAKNISLSSRVLDLNLPTDPAFTGASWFRPTDHPKATLFVTVRVDGTGLLAAADRAEYEKRLGAFTIAEKPKAQ